MSLTLMVLFNLGSFLAALYFMVESFREKERRAPYFGLTGAIFHAILFPIFILIPPLRIPVAILFGLYILFFFVCLIPGKQRPKSAMDYVVGDAKPFDERTSMFARYSYLEDPERYKTFYEMYPQFEAFDKERRAAGGFDAAAPGKIDNYYPTTKAMAMANCDIAMMFGDKFLQEPSKEHEYFTEEPITGEKVDVKDISPEIATMTVKNYVRHLGADLVGITKVDPLWIYTHRGEELYPELEPWGTEIKDVPQYAVVFAVEMDHKHLITAPHTPVVCESMRCYAKGVFISTSLANYFSQLGYKGIAQHFSHFDIVAPPLAVDAGIGELGRLGYIISARFGPRIRLGAVLTDMELIPDKPVFLGVQEFCRRCKKCASSCPSNSIPEGEKTVVNGIERWKLNDETCHMFWGKVGTDCAICMSICPYSRPNRPIHRLVRWIVARSPLAQRVFPYIDNTIYGKKWKPKMTSEWLRIALKKGEIY